MSNDTTTQDGDAFATAIGWTQEEADDLNAICASVEAATTLADVLARAAGEGPDMTEADEWEDYLEAEGWYEEGWNALTALARDGWIDKAHMLENYLRRHPDHRDG